MRQSQSTYWTGAAGRAVGLAHALDVLLPRSLAGDRRRHVARKAHEREGDQGHRERHEEREAEPLQDKAGMGVTSPAGRVEASHFHVISQKRGISSG